MQIFARSVQTKKVNWMEMSVDQVVVLAGFILFIGAFLVWDRMQPEVDCYAKKRARTRL
jgi:predicted small integral membrane protein